MSLTITLQTIQSKWNRCKMGEMVIVFAGCQRPTLPLLVPAKSSHPHPHCSSHHLTTILSLLSQKSPLLPTTRTACSLPTLRSTTLSSSGSSRISNSCIRILITSRLSAGCEAAGGHVFTARCLNCSLVGCAWEVSW